MIDIDKCQNPDCGSSNIFADHFESNTNEAWRTVHCKECLAHWTETYEFSRIEELVVMPIEWRTNEKKTE
ncbi:MAG: hypothetical protein ACXABD_22000 [Candidatus Thorarchaeota archaeon]|jgi:hypothetical protein